MTHTAARASAIDPLRLMLAVFVVALHGGFPDAAPALVKQVLFNGLYRLAVPVFAVISGYFFLAALRRGQGWRYLRRIAAVYLLWMVIYLPFYGPGVGSLGQALHLMVFGYFQLWFLPGLLVSAGLVMVLRAPRMLAGAAAALALTGLVLQYWVLSGQGHIPLDHYRNGLFAIFPWFAIGVLMAGGWGAGLGPRVWPLVALALGAVAAESLIWYRVAGGGWGVDMMLSLLVAAPLLFLAAQRVQGRWDGKRIAGMAAFVYFIHVLMMHVATAFGLTGDLKALVVMALCLAVAGFLATGGRRPVLAFFT